MYILAGTWPIANGTYYLAVEYQYAKQYPPNIAKIVFIPEAQLNGSKHYALFKITKTGNVFPTDLSYEQLAFSDYEQLAFYVKNEVTRLNTPAPIILDSNIDNLTLSDDYIARRIIFTNPNPCTVYLPSSGLVEGFYCLVRNSGGGSLTAQVVSPAVLENSFSTWSDPTKYCSIMLESTQPYFSYFLMGGLE